MRNQLITIQSKDLKSFDRKTNFHLNLGGKILDGTYQVISNGEPVYSHVIEYDRNHFHVSFWGNSIVKHHAKLLLGKIKHGTSRRWDEKGRVLLKGKYFMGRKHGLWTKSKGKKILVSGRFIFGRQHGKLIAYPNLHIYSKIITPYLLGFKHGTHQNFTADKLSFSLNYRFGKAHGLFLDVDNQGKVRERKIFRRGKLHGEYYRHIAGYKDIGVYKRGKKHGHFKKYKDGELYEDIAWNRGVKHGFCIEYDGKTKITGRGNYKYDYRQGKWVWSDGEKIVKEQVLNEWNELDESTKRFHRSMFRRESELSYWINKFTP
ncbi:MAG: hypothetical protein HN936_01960 [Bacteroidetes bacterium]|nr:hypothetical protein [Bacteroidota bacterium]